MTPKPLFKVMVANRLPYSRTDEGVLELNYGGLTTASINMMTEDSLWYGVDDGTAPHDNRPEMLPDGRGYQRRILLTPEEAEAHYKDMSNGVWWAQAHGEPDMVVRYTKERHALYNSANARVAYAVAHEVSDEANVLIHDYHMMDVAHYMTHVNPNAKNGFFMHIPWPSMETYERTRSSGIKKFMREKTERMLYANLLGFQTPQDVQRFCEYVRAFVNDAQLKENPDGSITIDYPPVPTLAVALPISVDPVTIREHVEGKQVNFTFADGVDLRKAVKKAEESSEVFVNIGRLDYSKRPEENMQIARYLAQMGVPLTYFFIGAPTRETLKPYKQTAARAKRTAREINAMSRQEFGRDIIFFRYEGIPWGESSMCLLRDYNFLGASDPDGKHVVPEEATIAQGVLPHNKRKLIIAGENTGFGWEIKQAGLDKRDGVVLVQPKNPEEAAKQIKERLDRGERVTDRQVTFREEHDVYNWTEALEEAFQRAIRL